MKTKEEIQERINTIKERMAQFTERAKMSGVDSAYETQITELRWVLDD